MPQRKRKMDDISHDDNNGVQFLIGNTYTAIPSSLARLDRTNTHRKIHDWTLYVDVVAGDPDIIEHVRFELPTFRPNTFTCTAPVPVVHRRRNGETTTAWRFKTRQQSYGSITAKITIRGVGGSTDTHSHRLVLSDESSRPGGKKSPLLDFHETRPFRPMKTIKLPDAQQFGIELELSSAADLPHETIADALEGNNNLVDVVMDYRSGRATSEHWKLVPDASIACSRDQPDCNRFELVSPILRGGAGLQATSEILQRLNNLRPALKVNQTMGFHVHVDVSSFSVRELAKICQNFIKYERVMDAFMPPSRRDGSYESDTYFRSNRLDSVAGGDASATNKQCHDVLGACTSIRSLVQAMNRNGRYYKLNLTNLIGGERYQPTIEFRQHSATSNYEKVGAWVRFCVAFCNNSARLSAPSAFKQNKPLEDQFDALFQYVIKDRALRDFYRKRREELALRHGGIDDSCCASCEHGGEACAVPEERVVYQVSGWNGGEARAVPEDRVVYQVGGWNGVEARAVPEDRVVYQVGGWKWNK